MTEKKRLPIGNDDFGEIRRNGAYYVDKSLMIRDFLEFHDKVALISRPRRFGKTLNMTMIREFFDITKDSRGIFEGLKIMDTEYADQINSRPVIYFTFKDCKGTTADEMFYMMKRQIYQEYLRYEKIFRSRVDRDSLEGRSFYGMIDILWDNHSHHAYYSRALWQLIQSVRDFYEIEPILLIDEYDQPIMSSYEFGYHDQVGTFFSNFYGSAMKGNSALSQALLSGVQRVAKESIFSQFNNARVYTVLHKQYAPYFGLTVQETERLLTDYGRELDEQVRKKYDGYLFGGIEMYNPWSVLNYADMGELDNYWVNTSSNYLVRKALQAADRRFWEDFDRLVTGQEIPVWLTLETSYVERDSNYSLWGLLVNSGYLTACRRIDANTALVKIPNDEVMSEFQVLISEISGVNGLDLQQMLSCLLKKDMERFFELYRDIVISCTSYMDAKENAYHMLFLGMCITLRGAYKVTSNIEAGYGRSDITLEALKPGGTSVIVEFKQGEDIEHLKKEALQQILDKRYYTGLSGEIICVGLAHDKKRCEMAYKMINLRTRR
ncbi:MAG: AAA family ATPase [Eubacteriales bacterium]|nr:AAA family ATPase [Eubacteriales bacterium]